MTENCKPCPHCGASLPAEASFCPCCAKSVNRRQALVPPALSWRRALRRALCVLLLLLTAGGGLFWYSSSRPQVYDGTGEITYTAGGNTYRLFLADADGLPRSTSHMTVSAGQATRFPARLYIQGGESGSGAGADFLELASQVTASFPAPSVGGNNISCTAPAPHEALPEAALVSFVDFTASRDFTAQLLWNITMKNGDVIRLRQELDITVSQTYDYYPEDAPMNTAEELQALLDQLAASLEPDAEINLHLPAVTYQGESLTLPRAFHLYGAAEGEQPTIFALPVQIEYDVSGRITYLYDLVFQGSGAGTALTSRVRTWVENCTFTGWDTGFLCAGNSWGNAISCVFADNGVGFRFDSGDVTPVHSMYNDNRFQNNGTAVVLERVPSQLTLDFQGSLFQGNGADIDNRCDHPLDLSQAVFQ